MARKFKRKPITEHGIYEVRLHDDYGFIEKKVIEVLRDYPYNTLSYEDTEDTLAPIRSLEEEYVVYQRKIGELNYPLTWRTPEELEQIKLKYPQYRNKLDASPE